MVMNTYENQPMTEQLTKYTKTVVFSDDNNKISSHHNSDYQEDATGLKKATNSNRQANSNYLIKSTSRGSSNMTGVSNGLTSAIGTPISLANANNNLPKPVLISTFNSNKFNPSSNNNVINESHGSNFKNENSLTKNDRIKSSQLARSVTMKYTKSHFDNTNTFTGNINQQFLSLGNGLTTLTPNNANSNMNNGSNGSGLNLLYSQNRKTPNSSSLQQQLLQNPKQQQVIIDLSNPKKEYYNSLHRSTSISLGREKSSLSNYFSTVNTNINNPNSMNQNNRSHLGSNNSLLNSSNGTLNIISSNNQTVNNYSNTKLIKRQTSFNSRNGNNTSTYNFGNDLNSSNLFQPANSTGTGRTFTPLSASNQNSSRIHPNTNPNLNSHIQTKNKTSLSLDNVFTNLDLILTNDTYLSSRPTNNMQHQANFLNSYKPNVQQAPLINNNGPKKIDLNNLNQYKTATITTINLLNNNYPANVNVGSNPKLTNNDNSINATNNFVPNANQSSLSTSINLLARKRSQKIEQDAFNEQLQVNNQHNLHQQHPPPGISLQSLNEESPEQLKHLISEKALKQSPKGNNMAINNGSGANENIIEIKETNEIEKIEHSKKTDNDAEENQENQFKNEKTEVVEEVRVSSGDKLKESKNIFTETTEPEANIIPTKKIIDPFIAATEPKVSLTSINDSQKNRNLNSIKHQHFNPSRSNSTYYNNLNMNNAIHVTGVNNYRLNKKSLDSNESPQLLQHHQNQLQYMQRSIGNNEMSFKSSGKIGLNNEEVASRISYVSRDVNESYAYTNVQQYIEENDLMPPEKALSIRKWITRVNSWIDDWEKRTIETNIEDSSV